MNKAIANKQKGFTIVELMISTIIFSLVLLGAMAALVQIGKLYYKGISNARTQELTRNVSTEISQGIQFTRQDVAPPSGGSSGFFCIGPKRFSYNIGVKLSTDPGNEPEPSVRHVLWADTPLGGCAQDPGATSADLTQEDPCDPSNPISNCSDGVELFKENFRLTSLDIQELSTDVWTVSLGIAYGDDDLLDIVDGRYVCEGSTNVSEFCSISSLSTTVLRRL